MILKVAHANADNSLQNPRNNLQVEEMSYTCKNSRNEAKGWYIIDLQFPRENKYSIKVSMCGSPTE